MRLVLILIFTFCYCTSFSQTDKLYLKDNNLLKGKLIGGCLEGIQFVISEEDTLDIAWGFIAGVRLNSGYPMSSRVLSMLDSINDSHNKQLQYAIGIGGFFDDSDTDNELRATLSAAGIYRLGQFLQIGLGFGLFRYNGFDALPVYIQYQGDLTHSSRQGLFYFLAAGRSFTWESGCNCSEVNGGIIYKAGLGYRFKMEDVDLNLYTSWVHQEATLKFNGSDYFITSFASYPYKVEMDQSLNSLEVGIMFTF